MSWMKRPKASPGAPTGTSQTPYNPLQPPIQDSSQMITQSQNLYADYSVNNAADAMNHSQDQYWQQQQHQANWQQHQQYNQNAYQQQDYGANNMNTYFNNQVHPTYTNQQPNFQQSYDNQSNQVQGTQPMNTTQTNANNDPKQNWDETWDWGWDEASKQQLPPPQFQNEPFSSNLPEPQNTQNNANVLEESFTNKDSWNWSVDDKNEVSQHQTTPAAKPTNLLQSSSMNPNHHFLPQPPSNSINSTNIPNDIIPPPLEENVATLNDTEVVKERIPNLALGRRLNLENLTPQWSMESQMSQESSDGPQTQSESTYKSENQSRNSFSPALGSENTNFNHMQSSLDDNHLPSNPEWKQADLDCVDHNLQATNNFQAVNQLATNIGQINLAERSQLSQEIRRPLSTPSPQHLSPTSLADAQTVKASQHLPPPTFLPHLPSNLPASSGNPFKRSGPLSHSITTKPTSVPISSSSFNPPNLIAPSVVGKVFTQQSHSMSYQTANLETTPENSERPDQPQMMSFRQSLLSQQTAAENLEIAPTNDRNQYLQSSLDSGDYETTNYSHQTPPPGLQRMVVGQQEFENNQSSNSQSDELPPGLSRMVPGQVTDDLYSQPEESYRDRHIDGQNTESILANRRPSYRQVEGQPTMELSYPPPPRTSDRRPIGLDRMVMGESSSGDFTRNQQFPSPSYVNNVEQRVVTGLDHDFIPTNNESMNPEIREQNVDGSDYSEPAAPPPTRPIRPPIVFETQTQSTLPEPDEQREVVMEGENLQDLSLISSEDLSIRDQRTDGAGTATEKVPDRRTVLSDSTDVQGQSSRRHSVSKASAEESERDRAFQASPRREREKKRSSKDKDGRSARDNGDYDRKSKKDRIDRKRDGDRPRDEHNRISERDRRVKDDRPQRRSGRDRMYKDETEDTDYYSDRERERRGHREGSYTASSKPPRPDNREIRYKEERDRRRGYSTIERERRYGLEHDRDRNDSRRGDRKDYPYDDWERKRGGTRRDREGRGHRSPDGRPRSRDPDPVEDEAVDSDPRRDRRTRRPHRERHPDPYYSRYGSDYQDPYYLQQQLQAYQYYDHLRLTNPVAYMEVYHKVIAGEPLPPPPPSAILPPTSDPLRNVGGFETGYPVMTGYDHLLRGGVDERGSVHSGRSSANGLAGKDTSLASERYHHYTRSNLIGSSYYCPSRRTNSVATDLSGSRDFNTDASLNLHLDESTVRSERNTPYKFSTAHVKGNISTTNIVMIHPSYPIDGHPATIEILSLNAVLENDPVRCELQAFPGPLVRGTTHKKSVIDFCENKIRVALDRNRVRSGSNSYNNAASFGNDLPGYVLLWEFLVLLLRQNGIVVGSDIAELLMKNKTDFEIRTSSAKQPLTSSRRNSVISSNTSRSDLLPDDDGPTPVVERTVAEPNLQGDDESWNDAAKRSIDEKVALEKFRDYLLVGNRKEALEWAMKCGLWGHAMQLAASLERRARLAVAARFLQSLPHRDPLHTLYCCAAARVPPAATSVTDDKWGDWRPHLAMLLSNPSQRPDVDKKTIVTLGDTLASRGLTFASQVCYLCSGLQFEQHPLAPWATQFESNARLSLLAANPSATKLALFATNEALHATEIYEYACSLNQPEYYIHEFQVYKFLLCTRLVDCGLYERALAYTECLARAVSSTPQFYPRQLIRAVAEIADRLKYFDPALHEEGTLLEDEVPELDSNTTSPRHQLWLTSLKDVIQNMENTTPQHLTPEHHPYQPQVHQEPHLQQPHLQPPHSAWNTPQAHENQAEPLAQETVHESQPFDYTNQTYYQENNQQSAPPTMYNPADNSYYYQQQNFEQQGNVEQVDGHNTQGYTDSGAWSQDVNQTSYGYNEPSTGERPKAAEGSNGTYDGGIGMPQISMPNSTAKKSALFDEYDDGKGSTHQQNEQEQNQKSKADKGDPSAASHQTGGWFGGIFNKLSLKPKNQMILPDDKNPSIVWDEDKKRWKNLDGDGNEDLSGAPPPPPKMADIAANVMRKTSSPGIPPSATEAPLSSGPPSSNIFKMQKSRQIKKAYVDVFNPSGAPIKPLPPASEVLGPSPATTTAPNNYFVPPSDGRGPQMYDPSQY